MKTKFTKGKWQYASHMNEHQTSKKIVADDGTKYHRIITICEVNEHQQRPGESDANAKLIAAAPELFHSLNNLISDIENNFNAIPINVIGLKRLREAREAIKKAIE
jgi:hypothetical protein